MAVERADLVQVVDRHDVAAALMVFQAHPVAAVALVQEVEEAGAEQFGEVMSRTGRQSLQEECGLRVDERAKVTTATRRVLHVRFERQEEP